MNTSHVKHRRRHGVTAAFAALGVTAALALAGCGGSSSSGTSASPLGPDRWMEDVYSAAPNTPLGQAVLPGTHDSGSYGIDVDAPCELIPATGTAGVINTLAERNPCAAADMYRAQNTDIGQQLAAGIRYLDLRVSVPKAGAVPTGTSASPTASGSAPATASPSSSPSAEPTPSPAGLQTNFVLEHQFVSTPLTSALDQILSFATSHPREQVILDFQHIDLGDLPDKSAYYAALGQLLSDYTGSGKQSVCAQAWSSDVVKATPQTLSGITFETAWKAKRNLVVLVPDGTLAANSCYYPREQAILSQWPNTEDPAKSVQANADELTERAERLAANPQQCSNNGEDSGQGDNWCGFFVNQMQLTFQPVTFAGCIVDTTPECSLLAYSQKVNNQVGPQVQAWAVQQRMPVNIVLVDFFEKSDPLYTQSLIDTNRQLIAARSASPNVSGSAASTLPSPSAAGGGSPSPSASG